MKSGTSIPDDGVTEITDAARLRALAHPARLTIMDRLRFDGPSTATELATAVALSPSATSYHLRTLAKVGLIAEAEGRGDGRERRWTAMISQASIRMGDEAEWDDPDVRSAETDLFGAILAWQNERAQRFAAAMPHLPAAWRSAAVVSDTAIVATSDEVEDLVERMRTLLEPYYRRNRTDPPADARVVSVAIRAIPDHAEIR